MEEQQLDLFAASGIPSPRPARAKPGRPQITAADLDDHALIAALPWAGLAEAPALAAEAGRRHLAAAVPALEQLCRRFAGFGLERAVPEQVAALHALAAIGGPAAAQAVARLIDRAAVRGPARRIAVGLAARLKAPLAAETVLGLLHHPDPVLRADACRCAGAWPAAVPTLVALTGDEDRKVSVAAWCALGRMGRREAAPALAGLLRDAPSLEVIDAVAAVADEDCVILLGRLVRTHPTLAGAARAALELIDHPRARQIVAALATEHQA